MVGSDDEIAEAKDDDELKPVEDLDEERKPKIGRVPRAPTTQEWNDHMTHHSEHRDWCPFCLQGKGISYQHRRGTEEGEKIGITVAWIGHT